MVQGVRFVAGLGVAHLPNHLTAERVRHVKPSQPPSPKTPQMSHSPTNHGTCATTILPFGYQGLFVAGLPCHLKVRARPFELRFSSSLSSPPAPLPVTRRVPLLTSASGAMTLLWRCTKSAASVSPCVVLIRSLMYVKMAA